MYKGVISAKKTNVQLIAVVEDGKRMSRKGQGTLYIPRGGMIERTENFKGLMEATRHVNKSASLARTPCLFE